MRLLLLLLVSGVVQAGAVGDSWTLRPEKDKYVAVQIKGRENDVLLVRIVVNMDSPSKFKYARAWLRFSGKVNTLRCELKPAQVVDNNWSFDIEISEKLAKETWIEFEYSENGERSNTNHNLSVGKWIEASRSSKQSVR